METTAADLFIRSEPRVAEDSMAYAPLLPAGTRLEILDGPVAAGGYVWYAARPLTLEMLEGPGTGWVAAGDAHALWIRPAGVDIARAAADVPRRPADPDAARGAAASIDAFGIDIYRKLLADGILDPTKGAVISPTSIAFALAMARAGARGETAAQMDRVLHTSGWDDLAAGLGSLDQALAALNGGYRDDAGTYHELSLRIANATFGQEGWKVEPAYLDAIAAAFGAGLQLTDFARDANAARRAINAWVSERTLGRIPELLGPGALNDLTRLVLVNAIYLKAGWVDEFEESDTAPRPFTRLDGTRVDVPTMHQFGGQSLPYARGSGWQATELLLRGPEDADGMQTEPLAMMFVLPTDLAAFESTLTPGQVERIADAMTAERARIAEVTPAGLTPEEEERGFVDCGAYAYAVDLHLPKFGVDSRVDRTAKALMALGMTDAFTAGEADLTGINATEDLVISFVIHQANIDVGEKGVEAAAATAVGVSTTGGCGAPEPRRTITLRFDRPFLFLVRDVASSAILFMGRVMDPTVRS